MMMKDILARVPLVSQRQVDHWSRLGFLSTGTPGSGVRRDYSEDDVRVVRALAAVSDIFADEGNPQSGGIPRRLAIAIVGAVQRGESSVKMTNAETGVTVYVEWTAISLIPTK